LRSVRILTRNDAVRSFAVAFAVITAVVAASCDKVPLTSPSGSTIQLSASSSIVPIDGSAEITATVTESAGTAVQNGTTVVFRVDLGRMDPQESQTVNGRATSRFFASGQSGVARINAFSGAAATGGTTSVNSSAPAPSGPLTILVGGAAASRITLRAEPPNIPQTGGTIQIIANVADTNGSPVQGAPVTFTVAAGGTGGTAGTGVLGSPSTQTNAAGVAQTSLTTNQTTTVTATVATAGSTTPVTANVVVTALAAPSLTLACPTATQSVGVAVSCTITPVVATGGSPIQNVTINWGDGTGEKPVGNVTGATVVSNTYTTPNVYTVTASATDLNSQRGQAVSAVVVQRVNPTISITGPATGTTGIPVTFTVTPPANPPQPITNVTVDFGDGTSRNLGAITGVTSFTKTFNAEGGYTVTATAADASGGRGSSSTGIVVTTSQPGATLTGPATLPLNTSGSFTVGATPSSGTTIRSVVVVDLDNGDRELFRGTSGGTFMASFNSTGNHRLEARVTDSTGTTSTARHQVVIQ